ncbi:hypothetical protein NCCP2716_00250 [Sporosarcina sp. NCCP-2716]|uniref:amidase n=1 Tax=Sporosarcina sp. NCCP-2716 TaxID=2943679 RepID=UPI00203CEAEE|nr:amidase [Sporosarcina sp. NCCP-2716]GKV67527.1 hypothetical protein NCCP2716_00250 [Sporosarcina sp. NCCP-2716]
MSAKSKVLCLLVLLLASTGLLPAQTSYAKQSDLPKATWLWDTARLTQDPNEVLTFLDQNRVTDLYLQINREIRPAAYRQFIRKAFDLGIRVHALDGAPDWALNDKPVRTFFNWLKTYQAGSQKAEQFSGVHLDIEPYILPDWSANKSKVINLYQQRITFAASETAKLRLPFGIDIPFWFHEHSYSNKQGKGNLSEWLIRNTDEVTIMAYRNTADGPNGIIAVASPEIVQAQAAGKPIRLGVETVPSAEGSNLSFHGLSSDYMNVQLMTTQNAFASTTSWNGFAVHSLESWMQR